MKSLSERLKFFINAHTEYKSIREFEREIGWNNNTINQLPDSPKIDKIESLQKFVPELNIDWLLTGTGEIFLSAYQKSLKPSGISTEVISVSEPSSIYEIHDTRYLDIIDRLTTQNLEQSRIITALREELDNLKKS